MNCLVIGKRVVNLTNMLYCEHQVYHDDETVKIYFAGSTNNAPLVFCENEAKLLWKYLESIAGKAK